MSFKVASPIGCVPLTGSGYAVRYQGFDGNHDLAVWNRTLVDELKWAVPPRPQSEIREPIYSEV
jgi:hypothetical protein